ncbi:Alpha-amylase [Colletotrichum orbiculare MAFF 240422]|uniref:alpha-amylase n=1 Tax=Colletotrichum orbiculare (strain 104-T / ATCC 96160 / CBS 514.97 / LARS 414 / MAFF 240422) TaxID=1213857 RepID=N4V9G3_COLOR|nr:Alpha-amylase [Colletotrichum orbiculare MAFF 240422]
MHSFTSFLSLLAVGAIQGVSALDAAGWRNQSIYQVITDRFATTDGSAPLCDVAPGRYCGGTWKGITNKLDYIQNLGATAIWISPVVKNVDGFIEGAGEGYHGFWTQDLYSLNDHFGTEADLKELSDALHARGMYLMVDVAPNHVGLNDDPGNYTKYTPFDKPEYYHKECAINWNNLKSEQLCWLEGLPDLRTEDAYVRKVYAEWIRDLVTKYGIDGLRVDTALEIELDFWTEGGFKEAAGVFLLGEISHTSLDVLAPYQEVLDGFMDYSAYHWLADAFKKAGSDLATVYEGTNQMAAKTSIDTSLLGSFVENQDQVRFAHANGDMALAKNLFAFTMLRDGIPITYYGQEQHFSGGANPYNREALWAGAGGYDVDAELYGWIQQANRIRARAAEFNADFLTSERTQAVFSYAGPASSRVIAFRKGQLFSMYTNGGVGAANDAVFSIARNVHQYAIGADVVDVVNCETFTVADHGRLWVQMPAGGLPRVFLPKEHAEGLCNDLKAPVSSAKTKIAVDKNTGYV